MSVLATGCLDSKLGFLPLHTNILEAKYKKYKYELITYNFFLMRNRAYFFSIEYVYLPLRGERSRKLNRLLSYWRLLQNVALHLHKVEGF